MLRRIPLPRSIALLVTGAWLAASLSSQVHHLVVQHVICPEHGKIEGIHPNEGEHYEVDQFSGLEASRFHGDHGCLFLGGFFSSQPPSVVETPVHAWTPPVALVAPEVHGVRTPPLRFAPKTSPPPA